VHNLKKLFDYLLTSFHCKTGELHSPALYAHTPPFLHLSHALREPTAEHHLVIQIHPLSAILFEKSNVAHHIMLTLLAFPHRNTQITSWSPACRTISAVMPIADTLMGISTSAAPTDPVDVAWLCSHPSAFSFLSSQFHAHVGFHKRLEDGRAGRTRRRFGWRLHGLRSGLLSLPCYTRSTQRAEDSLWLGRSVWRNLLSHFFPPPYLPPFEGDRLSKRPVWTQAEEAKKGGCAASGAQYPGESDGPGKTNDGNDPHQRGQRITYTRAQRRDLRASADTGKRSRTDDSHADGATRPHACLFHCTEDMQEEGTDQPPSRNDPLR